MSTKRPSTPPSTSSRKLRGAAEAELARAQPAAVPARPAAELLHELQVHQIELEMQNEALREAQVALEESRDRYVDLYEFAPVGYLTLNRDAGIDAINLTGAALLGEERKKLLQRPFTRLVVAADQDRWQRYFAQAMQVDGKMSCELHLRRSDKTVFSAGLDSRRSVGDGGAPTLRLTLTDISARVQAEQALHESETRFRTMADAAPALIWMAGVDKGCTWFNQQWLAFTGRSLAQELGDGWTEGVHADDLARCLAVYNDAFDRRAGFEIEYRLRRADGHYRWVLDRGLPRYEADRTFLGYVGSCVDVTRLKRAEEDLNRAQSVGHIGSWRFNVRRNVFVWSAETYRIFGIPEGTPLSYESFLGRVHPDDVDHVDRSWRAGARGEPYDVEHRLLVDGQLKWVREKAELEFDAQGQLRSGFGITQDITEIKLARQALVESQERFEAFMAHSPMASWIVDIEGRFQYVSPTYSAMFRVAAPARIGQRIDESHPPELAAKDLLRNRAVIDTWQPIETVQPGVCADGSMGEFLVVRFPIRDVNGRPLIGGIALDISARRQAVAELRAANERLESLATEQAEHLRELAGELTRAEQNERDRLYERLHDDVQPLLVAARLMLSGLSMRTPPAECLRIAAEAGEQPPDCLRILADVCEHISRVIVVARTLGVQLSPPLIRERGLNPALESLLGWVKENHGLAVELSSAPDVDPDDVAMRLLCFNAVRELLMNIVKHAGTDRATLRLQRVDGDSLRVTVVDRGGGFDPAAATSGSGLAGIARRLGMFGGSLQIVSRPGHGTVATLTVPLRPPSPAAAAGPPPGSRARPRRKKGKDDAQDPDRR